MLLSCMQLWRFAETLGLDKDFWWKRVWEATPDWCRLFFGAEGFAEFVAGETEVVAEVVNQG